MPRKKDKPENLSDRASRFWDAVVSYKEEYPTEKDKLIAAKLKIGAIHFSNILRGEREPSYDVVKSLAKLTHQDAEYLWEGKKPHDTVHAPPGEGPPGIAPAFRDERLMLAADEIRMVLDVLESDTHYATSLLKNIRSFHAAVEEKKKFGEELANLRRYNEALLDTVKKLELKISELEGRIEGMEAASFFPDTDAGQSQDRTRRDPHRRSVTISKQSHRETPPKKG